MAEVDEAVHQLELAVTGCEKKIATLSWKIEKFERVLFSLNLPSHSGNMMSMMANYEIACSKYTEILKLYTEQKKDQEAFIDTLQLQVNLVKSKMETLKALITKGRTVGF